MQPKAEQYRRIASVILAVLEGATSAHDALADSSAWATVDFEDKLVADSFHALKHFEIDEDIRQRDERYAQGQRESLKDYVRRLHSSCE